MTKLSRRDLMKVGVSGAAGLTLSREQAFAQSGDPAANQPQVDQNSGAAKAGGKADSTLFFFNDEEAKFIEAAVDRLIPADEWAGAKEAGVLYYIDRQLAGAYGAGARMYLDGPWDPDAPAVQGYQLMHKPADLYRIGIRETRAWAKGKHGDTEVWDLSPGDLDTMLGSLESGDAKLESIPSPVFFETLLANTIEGYFADPVYGGNRDMAAWRMIGFPGAYAQYVELVDKYNFEVTRPPLSIRGLGETEREENTQQHAKAEE